jgi:hypothetical protein
MVSVGQLTINRRSDFPDHISLSTHYFDQTGLGIALREAGIGNREEKSLLFKGLSNLKFFSYVLTNMRSAIAFRLKTSGYSERKKSSILRISEFLNRGN